MRAGRLILPGFIMLGYFGLINGQQTEWLADKAHSKIGFKIKHMGISYVYGEFKDWELKVTTQGQDFSTAQVYLEIDASSIDTRNAKRDEHLRSCDFFCVEKYPKIVFRSQSIKKIAPNKYELIGQLTMHGQTHEVRITLIHHGTIKDPWGNIRAGFTVEGTLDRYKWGITYGGKTETGELVIGREVYLDIHIELTKK